MTAQKYNLDANYGEDLQRNFYIGQGARIDISAFSKLDASNVTVQSAGHGRSNGDRIVIINSDYYNGSYAIDNAAIDSFSIQSIFEKTETKADWCDAFNLTGYTVEAKVWEEANDTTPALTLTASIVSAAGGHIRISASDTEIETLDIKNYLWDLTIIDNTGLRSRFFDGVFAVTGRGA